MYFLPEMLSLMSQFYLSDRLPPHTHTHSHTHNSQYKPVCGSSPGYSMQSVGFIRGVPPGGSLGAKTQLQTDLELFLLRRNERAVFALRGV